MPEAAARWAGSRTEDGLLPCASRPMQVCHIAALVHAMRRGQPPSLCNQHMLSEVVACNETMPVLSSRHTCRERGTRGVMVVHHREQSTSDFSAAWCHLELECISAMLPASSFGFPVQVRDRGDMEPLISQDCASTWAYRAMSCLSQDENAPRDHDMSTCIQSMATFQAFDCCRWPICTCGQAKC